MATRDLLSGPITLSAAAAKSTDVLHALQFPPREKEFYKRMETYRPLLSGIVAHHLGIDSSVIVTIAPQELWRHGSFNLCIPVHIDSASPTVPQLVTLRFPLPYRVGNPDEKLNSEAATYAWLHENCPSVPIPKLYGFGLSDQRFTNLELLPWWSRLFQRARRKLWTLFGLRPSQFVPHGSNRLPTLGIGYLLIQTMTSGKPLSESWEEKCHDVWLQDNLQRDIARIMLTLSRVPLPCIGAFRMDNKGYLRLDNRPLSVQSTIQENEGISVEMSRHTTFTRVDDFVNQHLVDFDNRLLHQPNAISNRDDACYQMTSLAVARVIFPQLFQSELRHGPFIFALTDLHRSNIFVDSDWKVTCIIDLEFACSWPIEFLQPPYWLGGKMIDEIEPAEFAPKHARFVELMKEQEQEQLQDSRAELLSAVIQRSWTSGAFWVTLAIRDPISFTEIFYDRILPCFSCTSKQLENVDYEFYARFWRQGVSTIIDRKLQDQDRYLEKLGEEFAVGDSAIT